MYSILYILAAAVDIIADHTAGRTMMISLDNRKLSTHLMQAASVNVFKYLILATDPEQVTHLFLIVRTCIIIIVKYVTVQLVTKIPYIHIKVHIVYNIEIIHKVK